MLTRRTLMGSIVAAPWVLRQGIIMPIKPIMLSEAELERMVIAIWNSGSPIALKPNVVYGRWPGKQGSKQ